MNELNRQNRFTLFALCKMLGIGILIGVILTCMCACKTIEYVNVPEYHSKYIAQHDTLVEKEYIQDSTIIYTKGDTVFTDRWKIRYKDREKVVLRDSIVHDSINVPVILHEKEKGSSLVRVTMLLIIVLVLMTIWWSLFLHNRNTP